MNVETATGAKFASSSVGTGFSLVGVNLLGPEATYLHQIMLRIRKRGSAPPRPNLSVFMLLTGTLTV